MLAYQFAMFYFNLFCLESISTSFLVFLQRKRHKLAIKKQRAVKRKEQQAEYAKLLAIRQREKTALKKAEKKKRSSTSSKSSSISRTTSRSSHK